MGRLTDDMTMLRNNINAGHESRLTQRNALVFNLKAQLSELASTRALDGLRDSRNRADFVAHNASDIQRFLKEARRNRHTMARQSHQARTDFVTQISKETSDLLTKFSADRVEMAHQSSKDRAEFVTELTKTTATLVNEAAQDRAHAHAAFFGTPIKAKKKTSHRP